MVPIPIQRLKRSLALSTFRTGVGARDTFSDTVMKKVCAQIHEFIFIIIKSISYYLGTVIAHVCLGNSLNGSGDQHESDESNQHL